MLINFVDANEELLEPYEWQDDDCYEEYTNISIYHVTSKVLQNFLLNNLELKDICNSIFIIGDGHYCFAIEVKGYCTVRRGTVELSELKRINEVIKSKSYKVFHYQVIKKFFPKEYGLTRAEKIKKEELKNTIDEIYVLHYEKYIQICKELNIEGENQEKLYYNLKSQIDKGYTHLHEYLYDKLVNNDK